MEFLGKCAIITGAGSGMGRLTAMCLAQKGANVVVTDVSEEAARAVVHEITALGGKALACQADVRDYAQVCAGVQAAIDAFGSIDILVNAAGGSAGRVFGSTGGFVGLAIEHLDWGIDVNFKGPIYFAHAVLPQMIRQNSGIIINIGSVDGQTGSGSVEYSAAKSGVMNGLTKSLALSYAANGIRVNCVSPGPVLTRPAMANMKTLLGRAAQPQEIVDLILYLCSDAAAFITGVNYMIDGGRSVGVHSV